MATATATLNRPVSRHTAGNGHTGSSNGNDRNGKTNGRGNGHGNGHSGKPAANGKPNGNGHSKRCAADIQLLANSWESAKTSAKMYYSQADQIEAQLIDILGVGGSLLMKDGRMVRVKDNFRDASGQPKVKAFAMAGVKLCEVEIK
jgi:hypothetical protein